MKRGRDEHEGCFEINQIDCTIQLPLWFCDLYHCDNFGQDVELCFRNVNMPCHACESDKFAKIIGENPFVTTILVLQRLGLPKVLASYLVKHYCIFTTNFRLTCPYYRIGLLTYHKHCTPLSSKRQLIQEFDRGKGEVKIKN